MCRKHAVGIHTPLCDLLGIELPIVQAPIGSATCPALAAAVSEAGGLGMLALSWQAATEIPRIIRETKKRTERPFGVNLVLEWDQHERLSVCLNEGVRIISFFWGNPAPYIQQVHEAGALAIHTVGSTVEAQRATQSRADAVVAQGWEAGGHVRGDVGTFSLVPRIVDQVAPVPVIAAGGIGDGRGVAAALMLGAAGVWVGTRFVASDEAAVHPLYKQKIVAATENDTICSQLFNIGWENARHRTLHNSTIAQWKAAGCPANGFRPGEGENIAYSADGRTVLRYSDVMPLPGMRGNLEALAMYAGQSAGCVSDVQPAREIVRQLARQATERIQACGDLP
jgi:nitronate monooxygenase